MTDQEVTELYKPTESEPEDPEVEGQALARDLTRAREDQGMAGQLGSVDVTETVS